MLDLKLCELKNILLESRDVDILLLKTTEGELGIMKGHESMVLELSPGPHRIKFSGGKEKYFYTLRGMASVTQEGVQIFSVKCLVSEKQIEDFMKQLEIKIIEQKEYDYDNLKKNIIKEFSNKVMRENRNL